MTAPLPLNFWVDGAHWTLCQIVSNVLGVCVVQLYNEAETRRGRARKGIYGLLVEAL
jgi:hypothetical protein